MADYGRKPKDYGLRFEVVEHPSEVSPGCMYYSVVRVGSAYCAYYAVVLSDGCIHEAENDPPVEAGPTIDKARKSAYALAEKRKTARSK